VKKAKIRRTTKTPKKPPAARSAGRYVLRLFVAGATARSHHAILRVRELCGAELRGRCTLEVVDIYQQPALARANQIVATPTLILQLPMPVRRFIGNLANIADLFSLMDVGEKSKIAL